MPEDKTREEPSEEGTEKTHETDAGPVGLVRSQQDFVFKNFARMPRWVQVVVYLLLVVVLVYSTIHLVSGEFVISGLMFDGDHPARGYEIRVENDKSYGTNYDGVYYVILKPLEYYTLLVSGELTLMVLKGELLLQANRQVKFNRLSQQLESIVIDYTAHAEIPREPVAQVSPSMPGLNQWFAWVASAASAPGEVRLIVYGLGVSPDAGQVQAADLILQTSAGGRGLLSTRSQGAPAGSLPIRPGELVHYGGDYYFSLDDPKQAGNSRVQLTLSGGFLSKIAQAVSGSGGDVFSLPANLTDGQPVTIKGQRGGQIQLILTRRFDVVLFAKGDLGQQSDDALKSKLLEHGFSIRERLSPLGYGQSNALYAGTAVPFTAVQQVISAASDAGVPLKTIWYKMELQSGNQFEIQIGQWKQCDDAPVLPEETLKRLANASSEAEFAKLATPLQRCTAGQTPVQQRQIRAAPPKLAPGKVAPGKKAAPKL